MNGIRATVSGTPYELTAEDPLAGAVAFDGGEAGQAAAGVEFEGRRIEQAGVTGEDGTDTRRDRADDRHLARNRDAAVRRAQEAADRARQGRHAVDPQQGSSEATGKSLNSYVFDDPDFSSRAFSYHT